MVARSEVLPGMLCWLALGWGCLLMIGRVLGFPVFNKRSPLFAPVWHYSFGVGVLVALPPGVVCVQPFMPRIWFPRLISSMRSRSCFR